MASSNDFEELRAALRASNAVIDLHKETIKGLRQQLAKAPAPVVPAAPVVPRDRQVTETQVADYVLAVAPKAVAMKTFKTYAKGPVTKNGFYYQARTYLRTVCKNGVDEHRRAMDALVGYHGASSVVELGGTEVEPSKFVVSFDTWMSLFEEAGFVPGPSDDYVPVHDLAKLPAGGSKTKSTATQSETTVTRASYKVVQRTAEE